MEISFNDCWGSSAHLLTVGDGDTVKCDGENMRLLVEGASFVSGIDTPQTHAKSIKKGKLALVAKERPKDLLASAA
ncbi:hypothetical protein U8Q06_27225 (plasmid) [Rhizobium beringeri]|uniref:hypothetical protein n=1 Tax=Rhizobium beringeri TaxID=3019934 RepID=UPI002E14E046|nr:hypothetical protein U8Q06_27225 [Rhizobium beringeri]